MHLWLTRNTPLQNCSLNLCISVPQKVSELKAGGGGWLRSLRVSWLPPAGDWQRYRLLLWNRSALVLNATLEKDTTEYLVHNVGLIPGRQYGVDVIVESGDLQSKSSCTGRTGQRAPLEALVCKTFSWALWAIRDSSWESTDTFHYEYSEKELPCKQQKYF